jgi:cell division protein FtsB
MKRYRSDPKIVREGVRQSIGIGVLLVMAGFAVAGPSGVLAWGRNQQELEVRRTELAQLTTERDELKNRVDLLDPRHVDRDFATELVRSRLNVAHPDDKVMLLH